MDSDSSHHTSNLGQCLAFFSMRMAWWLVLKIDGQMPLNERKRLCYFPYFSQHFLGVPVKISGTISVYGHFLHNGSLDLAEIWPEASLNISAHFPGTFSAINEFPFILEALLVHSCRNENKNKNKFDGIRTVPAVAKLSNTVMQCLSVNLWELIASSTLHYASSSMRNMAATIITSCSICYKFYWHCYYPLCFPFVLETRLPHLKIVRRRMGRRAHLWPENGHETGYNVEDMVQKHIDSVWKVYIKP